MPLHNTRLRDLFRNHGIEAIDGGDWLTFADATLRANAETFRESQRPAGVSVQLDVRLEIAPERVIVESLVGMGPTLEDATSDAFRYFAASSFHVLLCAFFHTGCEQVTQQDCTIGGLACHVVIGGATCRGTPPGGGPALAARFQQFESAVHAQQLMPGVHWVRLYYGHMQGKAIVCEVLLDNHPWPAVQAAAAAIDWPASEAFYSLRVFSTLRVEKGGAVSPETAVAWLAELAAPREFSEDELYAAMAEVGIPDRLADRAYKFTQTAWGRALLAPLGVRFSPLYYCFNAAGDVIESGRLADEPCFTAAQRLFEHYGGAPGCKSLMLCSAEVNAINQSLNAGKEPEGLVGSPAFFFLEAPTPEGMEKAQRQIVDLVAPPLAEGRAPKPASGAEASKPWWRFWH